MSFKSWRIGNGTLVQGDCEDVLRWCAPNSFSAMVTDPPYGLGFMGKKWDYDVPKRELWKRCLNVLKPGAHALIFAGSRTQHRMAVNVEDAGFQLKDTLMWLYGSGFPKSTDISKRIDKLWNVDRPVISERPAYGIGDGANCFNGHSENATAKTTAPATPEAELWDGWKTHLKPSYEPIILAMKPNDGSYAANALKHGVAGLNIDGCRIEGERGKDRALSKPGSPGKNAFTECSSRINPQNPGGRYPANVVLDEEAARMLDEQAGVRKSGTLNAVTTRKRNQVYGGFKQANVNSFQANSGGASRFFYCAKASRSERGGYNRHPTVKPIKLMGYLCRLVASPADTVVLDPFAGSGTTALACEKLGLPWFAIEREPEYIETIIRRFMEQ